MTQSQDITFGNDEITELKTEEKNTYFLNMQHGAQSAKGLKKWFQFISYSNLEC